MKENNWAQKTKELAGAIPGVVEGCAEAMQLLAQKRFAHFAYFNPVTIEFYEAEDFLVFYTHFTLFVAPAKIFKILQAS